MSLIKGVSVSQPEEHRAVSLLLHGQHGGEGQPLQPRQPHQPLLCLPHQQGPYLLHHH